MDKVTIEQQAAIKRGEYDYAKELEQCHAVSEWKGLYLPASSRAPDKSFPVAAMPYKSRH